MSNVETWGCPNLTDSGQGTKNPKGSPHEDTVIEAGSRQGELQRSIQTGSVGAMACEWTQRGQGGGRARYPPAASLSLGAREARAQPADNQLQASAQPGGTGGGEPTLAPGERQALGAA